MSLSFFLLFALINLTFSLTFEGTGVVVSRLYSLGKYKKLKQTRIAHKYI